MPNEKRMKKRGEPSTAFGQFFQSGDNPGEADEELASDSPPTLRRMFLDGQH